MPQKKRLSVLLALTALAVTACSDFATEPDRTPDRIRVLPDQVSLLTGESAQFTIELLDEEGEAYASIPAWAPPLWSSDRPERLEVADGLVTPVRGGETEVQVEVAGVRGSAVVRANPAELGLSVAMIYITQATQRTIGDVPVIAGRDGLLRVVVLGDDENYYSPRLRATLYDGDEVVYTALLKLEEEGLPTELDEGRSHLSYDGMVPGEALRPGVGLVVEIDPEGLVPASEGSQVRVPETGTLDLQVREVRPFRLMMVPVTLASNGGRTSRLTPEYAARVTRLMDDVFPLGEIEVEVREPYVTEARLNTPQGWEDLIYEIEALRYLDDNPHYYYGGFDRPPGTNIGGLGFVGYPVAIGMDDQEDVIAHEIGHTFSLPHAPCGGPAGPDPQYPYAEGRVGVYGYDRTRSSLQPPERYDLMSYCSPVWISDYNYEKVLAYRDTSAFDAAFGEAPSALRVPGAQASSAGPKERVLVVQGGVDGGELRLRPALEWTGRASLPTESGPYTLEGLDAQGGVLFSLSLATRELDHGGSRFLVAIPASQARPDELARLRLRGPEGVIERGRSGGRIGGTPEVRLASRTGAKRVAEKAVAHWDTGSYALAVVRDRETGRIRALSRTGTIAVPDVDPDRFEVVLSDGISSRTARVAR